MKLRDEPDSSSLTARVAELDEQGSLDLVRERVARGDDPLAVIEDCRRGMESVGRDYASGRYFIGGLIMAGEIFREAMDILEPLMPDAVDHERASSRDMVLVATVKGDIHDIGKNILVTLLRSRGFAVQDLGVDVPGEHVARRAVELQPEVVGLSGLLTAAHPAMRQTVAEVRRVAPQLGRPPVVLIGGAVDEEVCRWSGADGWADDAVRGVELIASAIAAAQE